MTERSRHAEQKPLRRDLLVAACCGALVVGMVGAAYAAVPLRATCPGQASYNVSPPTVGGYFNKINCFCFTEQRLKAGETREMAVVFYIDPSIANDRDQNDLSTITLSYTFYRQRESERPIAEAPERNSNRL
jgi:cytochrome c oxidase assembly protein Cox11